MRNLITLQKNEKGEIICEEISQKGIEYINEQKQPNNYWKSRFIIKLDEIEKLLDKVVNK